MIILDAHQDIAYNALTFNRDYRKSALITRRLEELEGKGYPKPTLGLPEAIAGRVAVVFSTLFNSPAGVSASGWPEAVYANQQEAHTLAMRQIDFYERLADESQRVRIIRTQADLDAVLATWEHDRPISGRQQGFVILMEGADPVREPQEFELWYERGVRVVGLSWAATSRYAAGNGKDGTLTKDGYALLDVMAGFGAILDLSHLNENATHAALDHYTGTIIASHSNPRKFCDSDRHLSDTLIQKLAERDGVMGIVLYNRFLSPRWTKGDAKASLTLDVVADAIDHVCQVTGSAAHVGIGSDYDGGFGSESIPYELDTVADTGLIGRKLASRGYSEADIAGVMSGNMLRKLREGLK
jgi:membrane dipeptidase